jgi:Secretion system C-terminal sorting domain
MKKIYLIATSLIFGASAFGQIARPCHPELQTLATETVEGVKNSQVTQKAPGVVIWSSDFSTPADWTIDNSGQTQPNYGWAINATEDSWYFTSQLISTSGGNKAELGNGPSSSTAVAGVVYTMTTASPINIAAYNDEVRLSFMQYGARFRDLQEFQISTDGTTFITVGDNMSFPTLTAAGGAAYPNPTLEDINLKPFLSGATQLWVRFSWQTNIAGSTSATDYITYGWTVDDVVVSSNGDNDLQVSNVFFNTVGLAYYQIPLSQVAPIDFYTAVNKTGINNIIDATYTATANPGAISGSSAPVTLTTLVNDTLMATINPTALGSYTVTGAVVHDSIDDNPINNAVKPINFSITNFMYARDNNVPVGTVTNTNGGYEAGNLFDIWADVTCWGINARLATGTPAGTPFNVKLYSIDPTTGDFVYETESAEYLSTNSMLNNDRPYVFPSAHQLFENTTYLAVVVSTGGLVLSRGGISDPQTSFFQDETGTWFYTTNTPWVRLNLDPSLGFEENAGSIASSQIFPNPTTGNSTLSFSLTNPQEVTVTVFDMAGKEMTSMDLGAKISGDHSIDINSNTFNSGVYFVNIVSNDGVVTKKLVKK